jgi:hypothetical protein
MLFLASTFSSAALQLPARSSVASHSRVAVSMIAPVEAETETKKAVEGPTLSSMVNAPSAVPQLGSCASFGRA